MALVIALTGGTGFVGGHSINRALARGHQVRALTRRPQPAKAGVTWVSGDLTDKAALAELVSGADVVLHIAGVTNAPDKDGFVLGNITGTENIVAAANGLPFVHVSSLSAREPQLSTYGWSKLKGEEAAMAHKGRVTSVRPPAVYGPGDREFLELFKTAKTGFLPMPQSSRASMIYGADLAAALIALCDDIAGEAKSDGQIYEIDDGTGGYAPQQVGAAISAGLKAVGLRDTVKVIEVSPLVLRLAARADTLFAKLKGTKARLSLDRAGYMSHTDWTADARPLLNLGIWKPEVAFVDGMIQTAQDYSQQGILK